MNGPIGIDLSGYLIEELRNDSNFEDFKEDIANADIFVASLIFIEDLAQKVVDAVSKYMSFELSLFNNGSYAI